MVRLATIHYKPNGETPQKSCEEFAPLIADAAKEKASLVVLFDSFQLTDSVSVGTETTLAAGMRRIKSREFEVLSLR